MRYPLRVLLLGVIVQILIGVASTQNQSVEAQVTQTPQLVLLDTDIGDDIDDVFALSLLLKSPEVKLLGITTAYGDTELRARLLDR